MIDGIRMMIQRKNFCWGFMNLYISKMSGESLGKTGRGFASPMEKVDIYPIVFFFFAALLLLPSIFTYAQNLTIKYK